MARKFVTVKHVPLCKVGQWGASTGPVTLTPDVLMSMVEAEPEIGRAVIKIGHRDPRFSNPVYDGEPAYGQVSNLAQEGDVLYGDLVNVPEELADSLKSSYPNRSVEIAWNLSLKDAAGQVRKTFKAALIGLALLGQTPPAVQGLAALSGSAGGYDATSTSMLSSMVMTEDADLVQEALRDAGEGVYADSRDGLNLLELDEKSISFSTPTGNYRAAYTIEDGIYVFSDTAPVTGDFPHPVLSITDADHVSIDGESAAGKPTSSERSKPTMDFLDKLREKLGLPEGATEDEIFTAANPAAQLSAETGKDGAPAGTPAVTPEAPKTIQVSEAAFMELQTNFSAATQRLADLESKTAKKDHDQMITSYLSEGRIHPTEEDYWRGQLDKDETATVAFLSGRTPVIPVGEIGSSAPGTLNVSEFSKDGEFESALAEFGMRPESN